MLQVPFYLNHGHRCAQAAMKSVIAARGNKRVPTFEELDQLTKRFDGQITLPCQIASGLSKLDIDFQYFVKPDWFEMTDEGLLANCLNSYYGLHSSALLNKINFGAMKDSIQSLRRDSRIIVYQNKPSIEELKNQMSGGNIPLCLINFDCFVGRTNKFNGHYIVLTDFNEREVTYHDNGPDDAGANLKMPLDKFVRCWNLCFMDHDLLVIK
jgi:hypothetical protein